MYMEAIEGVENVSVLTLLFCSEKKKARDWAEVLVMDMDTQS